MKGQSSQAGPLPNAWLPTVTQNLTAAGTTQTNAYQIPSGQDFSLFTTVGSGTGATLPANGVGLSESYIVANHGVNAILVYPAVGGKIGTLSANAGYSLAAGKFAIFAFVGQLAWASCP